MINAAIIGLGYIGKVHLRTLLRIPGVVVALAGRRREPLEELAAVRHSQGDSRLPDFARGPFY